MAVSDWGGHVWILTSQAWLQGLSYAIETNLRKGGTTHPFPTLQFVTDRCYNSETVIFTAPNAQQKFLLPAITSSRRPIELPLLASQARIIRYTKNQRLTQRRQNPY